MGNACNNDNNVSGDLPDIRGTSKGRVSEDPSLVLPEFADLRNIINRKAGELDMDITRSERGGAHSETSLVLPASKSHSPTLIIKYFLVYSFYIGKYSDKGADKRKYQKLFYELLDEVAKEKQEKESVAQLKADIQK